MLRKIFNVVFIKQVDADDVDSGKNGVVKFFLDEESSRKFTVETFTGVLMVASALDREQVRVLHYHFLARIFKILIGKIMILNYF